ncbi:MAG: transcriptional repressor LexA [Gammaproteobacteria bacterium]
MNELTARQAQILALIRQSLEDSGMPPTRAEIARALGFRSVNGAEGHLKALARKGVIELVPGASRGIRLRDAAGLPVVGRVAAGSPILSEPHIETHYQVDPRLFRPAADYLLRVRGDSMQQAGILDGDLLVVHRRRNAENGQIVVARLEDEVTVKRFRRQGNQVHLLPENSAYAPIVVDLRHQRLEIEGIGVGVIRAGAVL